MTFFQEEILEPVARYFRFKKTLLYVPKNRKIKLVDIGCGPKIRFFYFASRHSVCFYQYIGIDPLISSKELKFHKKQGSVVLHKQAFVQTFKINSNSIDCITAHAFVEHINPVTFNHVIKESLRILKPNGKLILTTPSPKAQKLLEFLAYRLKLLSKREIEEHKLYYDRTSLLDIVKKYNHTATHHEYFQLGFNNLMVITKR